MSSDVQVGTIRTRIPARLDRLPWSRFHWRVVIGLGTVWILDGLEVTIVGSIAARLTEKGSGIAMTASDIGMAAAIYVAGACCGALFFGQLTDRFGRKKLFMLTLGVYLLATVATAFAFAPWYFFLCRFFAGAGIGGEYAAINSAIDELIPARNRGQVDITINGSYWIGAAIGAIAAVFLLNTSIFPADLGWRLAFGMGGVLGIAILIVRRHVPESPRWLFIHGQEDEAEKIVDRIEAEVREDTQLELAEPGKEMTVRQRTTIPFREIAKVAFQKYPKRAILGLALFIGQAFLYNAITFDLGTILSEYFDVASGAVPYFILIFAAGNFLGPFLLGRLFDTVGRKPMIAGTYLIASASTAVLAFLLLGDGLTKWSFIAMVGVTFFFASAGASSAYLTVSEIFPMETRALAIALLLRGRHGGRRHHRTAAVRPSHRQRRDVDGRDRLLHRRRRHGARRHRRDLLRRARRERAARGHRDAADGRGRRGRGRGARRPHAGRRSARWPRPSARPTRSRSASASASPASASVIGAPASGPAPAPASTRRA